MIAVENVSYNKLHWIHSTKWNGVPLAFQLMRQRSICVNRTQQLWMCIHISSVSPIHMLITLQVHISLAADETILTEYNETLIESNWTKWIGSPVHSQAKSLHGKLALQLCSWLRHISCRHWVGRSRFFSAAKWEKNINKYIMTSTHCAVRIERGKKSPTKIWNQTPLH